MLAFMIKLSRSVHSRSRSFTQAARTDARLPESKLIQRAMATFHAAIAVVLSPDARDYFSSGISSGTGERKRRSRIVKRLSQ
jgi:hypothetical protein